MANTPGEKINEVEDIWYTDKWETSSGNLVCIA